VNITTAAKLTPLDELIEYPGNARRGDLDVIAESIRVNGFYGVVVRQQSTGYVLAGNHRLRAAKMAGLEMVPVQTLDVDDATARRINLIDNQANQLAGFDSVALKELLDLAISEDGLEGTGFTMEDLADLAVDLETVGPAGEESHGQFSAEMSNTQNVRRQIVLDLPIAVYVWAVAALERLCEAEQIPSNSAATVWLLSRYVGEEPPNV
jgi:hypothetical protein